MLWLLCMEVFATGGGSDLDALEKAQLYRNRAAEMVGHADGVANQEQRQTMLDIS